VLRHKLPDLIELGLSPAEALIVFDDDRVRTGGRRTPLSEVDDADLL
jgi:hypothetical protein